MTKYYTLLYLLYLLSAIISSIVMTSCDDTGPYIPADNKMPLVVEGWIEDDAAPMVIITRATNLNDTGTPLDDLVERWCRVTVSDGSHSEVLPMRINSDYVPGVVYSSNKIKGKAGHTYTLTVETENDTVTAVTTIPPVARIDSLHQMPVDGSDSLYSVRAYARIDAGKSRFYKFFSQVCNDETRYYSSFLGTFRADEYDKSKGRNVARGIHKTFEGHFTPHYRNGDTLNVKLCTMDSVAYDFWQAYEAAVSLGGNMFFTVAEGCPSNIKGGLGYWIGYGTSMARIIIRDDAQDDR